MPDQPQAPKPRRNLCHVIDAICAIVPELKERLTPVYQRAVWIAPEAQPSGLWTTAHNILADWSNEGIPLATIDRVGRLWAGLDPLPERSDA